MSLKHVQTNTRITVAAATTPQIQDSTGCVKSLGMVLLVGPGVFSYHAVGILVGIWLGNGVIVIFSIQQRSTTTIFDFFFRQNVPPKPKFATVWTAFRF